jgi:transducin (beta)-like 1
MGISNIELLRLVRQGLDTLPSFLCRYRSRPLAIAFSHPIINDQHQQRRGKLPHLPVPPGGRYFYFIIPIGFEHSSFVFGQESYISKPPISDVRHSLVPPGMLISLMQKGLQYLSIEHHLNEDGTEKSCNKPFHILEPHVCEEPMVTEEAGAPMLGPQASNKPIIPPDKLSDPYEEMKQQFSQNLNNNGSSSTHTSLSAASSQNGISSAARGKRKKPTEELPLFENEFQIQAHEAQSTACAFNPQDNAIFASCSSDGNLKIWNHQRLLCNLNHAPTPRNMEDGYTSTPDEQIEVTCLQWSLDGKKVLTGSLWGSARIWNAIEGTLEHTMSHGGEQPVLAAKFNPKTLDGSMLATLHETNAVIWRNGTELLRFSDHRDVAMDLDWNSYTDILATCSKDKSVQVYYLSEEDKSILAKKVSLSGHFDDVNTVRWCPSNPEVLASCSDDTTVILWKPGETGDLFHRFSDHNQEIYTFEWGHKSPLLAT